jgi:hypothetical protein
LHQLRIVLKSAHVLVSDVRIKDPPYGREVSGMFDKHSSHCGATCREYVTKRVQVLGAAIKCKTKRVASSCGLVGYHV